MDHIRMARVRPNAVLPTRKHPVDAGLDIYAAEEVTLPPHSTGIVPSGIKVDIPTGYVGLLKPKGRNDHLLGAGVVDAGYQGELLIKVANHLDRVLKIHPGEAIGQLLILPVATPQVEEVPEDSLFPKTSQRGAGGGIVSQFNQP
jgi:dUTP pyrophosphatase